MRADRPASALRKIKITTDLSPYAEGSALVEFGNTKVLCTASVEERVPPYKLGSGEGWITAEYSMLPRATMERNQRDISRLKLSPRSAEIQRLVGRSLRAVADLELLGERTIIVDCDVLCADGGTRTASVTGGFVALYLACKKLIDEKIISKMPLSGFVAAVSVGISDGGAMLDLCYEEDKNAQVDMNVVMNDKGEFIEIQGTGEEYCFNEAQLKQMLALAKRGINKLVLLQKKVVGVSDL